MRDTHGVDTGLTKDEEIIFSLSYRGFSGRMEMVCMLGWYYILKAVLKYGLSRLTAAGLLSAQAGPGLLVGLLTLFCILYVVPLYVRRARQMGAAWYGVLAFVLYVLPILGAAWLAEVDSYQGDPRVLIHVGAVLLGFAVSLPLYLYGGTFSGKKNELHRAAMAGDMPRVRRLAVAAPRAVAALSEKGLTAREYAQRMGHTEVVEYLRKVEQEYAGNI